MRDGILLGEMMQSDGQTHSRTLLQMGEALLKNCAVSPEELHAVAAAIGPGSFTGLRIGVAAAKGIAWGRELPCVGVSTLEAMAHCTAAPDCIICCCMDARRSQIYNALFEYSNGQWHRICEDRAISAEDLKNELNYLKKQKILVGDGAELCYNTFGGSGEYLLAPQHLRLQRACGVAALAWEKCRAGQIGTAAELIPNYIRLSQAERERTEKEMK